MKELALHILDLVQNSISAGADQIELTIEENILDNLLKIQIADNGCGMSPEKVNSVIDPFFTTRTTRSVGLGVPMFKMNAELCQGEFDIRSTQGVGTTIYGTFQYDHIDRAPLGDMPSTIVGIVLSLDSANFIYNHSVNSALFSLSTIEMRKMLGDKVSLSEVSVLQWVGEYVKEGIALIRGKS